MIWLHLRAVVTICTTHVTMKLLYRSSTQCVYVFCVDLRTNRDYFPIQRCAVGSCSGTRLNATVGVWDATLYSPMSHDLSEEPATFVMIVHYNAASPTVMMKLAGFCARSAHIRNVRTHLPHSTAIPKAGNLTHCGRVTQICVFTLQLCRTGDAVLRF